MGESLYHCCMAVHQHLGKLFRRRKAAHLRFGARGERLAQRLLVDLGLEVLTTNYAGPHGEIDIVARDGLILCFVEVKSRRRVVRSRPAEAVNAEKKEHIVRTAKRYLRQIGRPSIAYRFDLVELVFSGLTVHEAYYYPGAFSSLETWRENREPNEVAF